MAFTFQNVAFFFVFTLFTGRGLRLSKPRELRLQKPYVCDFLLFFFFAFFRFLGRKRHLPTSFFRRDYHTTRKWQPTSANQELGNPAIQLTTTKHWINSITSKKSLRHRSSSVVRKWQWVSKKKKKFSLQHYCTVLSVRHRKRYKATR